MNYFIMANYIFCSLVSASMHFCAALNQTWIEMELMIHVSKFSSKLSSIDTHNQDPLTFKWHVL